MTWIGTARRQGRAIAQWIARALVMLILVISSGPEAQANESAVPVRFLDRTLIDTNAKQTRFVRDIIANGPTVISFTYLSCRSICPVADLTVDQVVTALATSGGGLPAFVTLTIDPFSDTPALLAERALQMDPRRRFLSGEPQDVVAVVDGLGMRFGRIEDHDLFILVVGKGGKTVVRLPGLVDPDAVIKAVRVVQQ